MTARSLRVIDDLMGELWPGASTMNVRDQRLFFDVLSGRRGGGGSAGSGARAWGGNGRYAGHTARGYLGALRGTPEAMVKVIRNGGARTAHGLKAQLAYLSRGGDLPVYDAGVTGTGEPMSKDEVAGKIDEWTARWFNKSKYGNTIHLVVSYPIGTSEDAAITAAEEFAETAFGSGDYGDTWDYVAAIHTQLTDPDNQPGGAREHNPTKHPHMHLIINRRGLDNGQLLSTYKGSALNPDHMRTLQAEIANKHGIDMVATSRIARGLTEFAPKLRHEDHRHLYSIGNNRSDKSMAYAVRAMAAHSKAYRNLAGHFTKTGKDVLAMHLQKAANIITEGREFMAQPAAVKAEDFRGIGHARAHVLATIQRADQHVRSIQDPIAKAKAERDLGELKGRAAAIAPDNAELVAHSKKADVQIYCSKELNAVLEGPGLHKHRQALAQAQDDIRKEVANTGIDPNTFFARFASGGPLDAGTAAKWAADDVTKVLEKRGIDQASASGSDRRDAAELVDSLHLVAERCFRNVAERIGLQAGLVQDQPVNDRRAPDRATAQTQRSNYDDQLRQQWNALSARQKNEERQAYTQMRIESGRDSDDHPYARVFKEDSFRQDLAIRERAARDAVENSRDRQATANEVEDQKAFIVAVDDSVKGKDLDQVRDGNPVGMRIAGSTSVDRAQFTHTYVAARQGIQHEQIKAQQPGAVERAQEALTSARAAETAQARGRDDEREL